MIKLNYLVLYKIVYDIDLLKTRELNVLYFLVHNIRALADHQKNVSLVLALIFRIVKYQLIY